ncbi:MULTISPECIES: hypothetical protein [Rhizobium/Agrobacterium group]|jgi:hypothetical protein|uniref:hypothetical protein n=1 Tax=Rhizobium/Agrobacterium group TaxID=227290 RepID=UPI000715BA73|nr:MULTISPECIES: hypothetical protein [Rhizobium/Agrobacterium group]KQY36918.1 hypothetical protein ASD46_21065 [Rhizobium sp. Root491]MDP9759130.1 hypothetical protein [Agrobacterium tumefaciens]MDQ1223560.1 hypothetical protein [Agrobacterium sp. SORGH_AS_0745]
MTTFMQSAEPSHVGGRIMEYLPTVDDLRSLSPTARHDIIIELAARLDEISRTAHERERDDLEAMLAYLSISLRESAIEIASECYGPFLIERMSASVKRIEQNFER